MGESKESPIRAAELPIFYMSWCRGNSTYESEALHALSGVDLLETITEAAVEAWVCLFYNQIQSVTCSHSEGDQDLWPCSESGLSVSDTYLSTALDNIKRADSCVRDTAGKDASDHALGVVAHIVDVTHFVVGLFSLKSQFSWINKLASRL